MKKCSFKPGKDLWREIFSLILKKKKRKEKRDLAEIRQQTSRCRFLLGCFYWELNSEAMDHFLRSFKNSFLITINY